MFSVTGDCSCIAGPFPGPNVGSYADWISNGHCYVEFMDLSYTWSQAKNECESGGPSGQLLPPAVSRLAVFEFDSLWNEVQSQMSSLSQDSWFGLDPTFQTWNMGQSNCNNFNFSYAPSGLMNPPNFNDSTQPCGYISPAMDQWLQANTTTTLSGYICEFSEFMFYFIKCQ